MIHVNDKENFMKNVYDENKPWSYYLERIEEESKLRKQLQEQRQNETEIGRIAIIMVAQEMIDKGYDTRDCSWIIDDDDLPF